MSGDIHALSGAYAVDAVDDVERVAFERHLAQCDACTAEVESLRAAAGQLAQISLAGPPPSLRASILAEIDTVRPAPPVVSLSAHRRERARRRPASLLAAAAALVLVGGVGATVWHPWESSDSSQVAEAPSGAAQRVIDAADAKTFTETTDDGVTLTVTHSRSLDRSVLSASGLAPLSDEQVYELWLEQDGELVAAGFLKDPTSATVLQGDSTTAALAGVTIEPAGGSTEPSMNNLIGTVPLGNA